MGIAELDKEKMLLLVRAHIALYGDAASEGLAMVVANEIEQLWSEPEAVVKIKGVEFTVQFKITSEHKPALQPEEIFENTDPMNNYFRVEEESLLKVSFVDGIGAHLGCNTGYFMLLNLSNGSTTAAHEFGHTIGLEHPENMNIIGKGIPGIMYPRGTLVDPQFQYDPSIMPGLNGGTMNPAFRKVQQQDIDDLRLHKLHFNEQGIAVIGEFSSIWHNKH